MSRQNIFGQINSRQNLFDCRGLKSEPLNEQKNRDRNEYSIPGFISSLWGSGVYLKPDFSARLAKPKSDFSRQQTKPFANDKGIIEGISIFDDIKVFENLIDESQQKITHGGYLERDSNSDIRRSGGYLEPDVVGHETTRHFSDQQAKPFADDEGIAEEIPVFDDIGGFENLEDLAANIDLTDRDNSNNSLQLNYDGSLQIDPSPRSNSYSPLPSKQVSPRIVAMRIAAMRDLEELANSFGTPTNSGSEHHCLKVSGNSLPEGSNVYCSSLIFRFPMSKIQ